ncbi:MAG: hypothetical protein AAGH15_01880 [Myxococcota bacterium]
MRRVLLLSIGLMACATGVGPALEDARDAGAAPTDLEVRWTEPPGPVGGRELVVRTQDGGALLVDRLYRPDFFEAAGEGAAPEESLAGDAPSAAEESAPTRERVLEAEELAGLVALLVEVEAWRPPARGALDPPVEGREAALRIRVGSEVAEVRIAVADLAAEGRLVRVRDRLLALAGAR